MDMCWPQRVTEAARRSGVATQAPPLQLLRGTDRPAPPLLAGLRATRAAPEAPTERMMARAALGSAV